jgi:hypothetical protein
MRVALFVPAFFIMNRLVAETSQEPAVPTIVLFGDSTTAPRENAKSFS